MQTTLEAELKHNKSYYNWSLDGYCKLQVQLKEKKAISSQKVEYSACPDAIAARTLWSQHNYYNRTI